MIAGNVQKNTLLWVDLMRVAGIFFVICLHAAADLLHRYNDLPARDWWAGNIYDSLVRMAVPLFFMLSGFLLLGKQEPIRLYAIKRVNRIVVPLIAWSLLYIFWKRYFLNGTPIEATTFARLLLSPAHYHLWFLYALIGLYLYIPVLRPLVQYASDKVLYYFILLWFIAVSVLPLITKFTGTSSSIDLKMISGFVGYLVLGHLLGNITISRPHVLAALVGTFVGTVVTMGGTYVLTASRNGVLDQFFYGYLSPNVIILSASTFILLRYVSDKLTIPHTPSSLVKKLSAASFGIYFLHPMVLFHLSAGSFGFSFSVFSTNAFYSVPIVAILTFIISASIIVLTQQLPFLKRILS